MAKTARQKNKKRASKILLSLLAVLVTLIPLFSAGVWVRNTFFSDPRHTIALETIKQPEAPVRPFEEPIVSVTFDDGWESIYSKGALILQRYGIRTTQYVLSGTFGYHNYLSREQIISLHNAGHDIQSHTVAHSDLTALTPENLTYELRQSKTDIGKLLNKQVTDFASPLNRYNQKVVDTVMQEYRSHRNTEADVITLDDISFNTAGNFNPYQINAFSVRRTTTVDQIKKFLQAAKERNAWVLLIYHQVDDESEDYYAVSQNALDEQMAAVASSGLRVATVDEVLDAYLGDK